MTIPFLPTAAAARHEVCVPALTSGRAGALFLDERGAATAEYAIATMAAVAFAGLLVMIHRSLPTSPRARRGADGERMSGP